MATYNVEKGISGGYTNPCPGHPPSVLGGGFAVDIDDPSPSGGAIVVFRVPNSDFGEVTQVKESCQGNAGKSVILEVFDGGRSVGVLAYTHIEPVVQDGDRISNGGIVGTVGDYRPYFDKDCWTGTHLHQEWRGAVGQSCLNGSTVVGTIVG